jgi:hypothetical protein
MIQEDFGMWREVEPQEIELASKPISKLEVLFWLALVAAMFMGEYLIVN